MTEDGEYVVKHYRCKTCNTTHSLKLHKNLLEGRSRYPFPYITLHSEVLNDELREYMVMLYIDRDLQIRGVEPLESHGDFFTKDQMMEITSKLMEEIELLREENLSLIDKLNHRNGKE